MKEFQGDSRWLILSDLIISLIVAAFFGITLSVYLNQSYGSGEHLQALFLIIFYCLVLSGLLVFSILYQKKRLHTRVRIEGDRIVIFEHGKERAILKDQIAKVCFFNVSLNSLLPLSSWSLVVEDKESKMFWAGDLKGQEKDREEIRKILGLAKIEDSRP
jgi:hypothetical protein